MASERILLCMDDAACRRRLAATLREHAEAEVVAATAADESGIRAAAARQPDVILVQAAHPGVEGAKLVGHLRAAAPHASVVGVAAGPDRPRSALARGLAAHRYVDADADPADLLDALAGCARERRARLAAS